MMSISTDEYIIYSELEQLTIKSLVYNLRKSCKSGLRGICQPFRDCLLVFQLMIVFLPL